MEEVINVLMGHLGYFVVVYLAGAITGPYIGKKAVALKDKLLKG